MTWEQNKSKGSFFYPLMLKDMETSAYLALSAVNTLYK